MKATFGTKQELKSLEFGTLLHGILPKGVYKIPDCKYSNGTLSVDGGVFLLYDSTVENYAVRVEDVSCTLSGIDSGDYVFISYTYTSSEVAVPALSSSSSINPSGSQIRLGRLIQTSSNPSDLAFDTSSMELAGPGFSVDDGLIKYLDFHPLKNGAPEIAVALNHNVMTNSGFATISSDLSNVDPAKAQYLYIDSEGKIVCEDSTVPRFSKLVIAEKDANRSFILNRFPVRAEVKGWDIETTPPEIASTDECKAYKETLYSDANTNTKNHFNNQDLSVTALSGLLETAVSHICKLEKRVDDLTTRLEYLEKVKAYIGGQLDIPDAEHIGDEPIALKLVMENVEIKSSGNVNIKGSVTVDSNTSSFGTSTDPIHNLYVVNSLYTDRLFVTE